MDFPPLHLLLQPKQSVASGGEKKTGDPILTDCFPDGDRDNVDIVAEEEGWRGRLIMRIIPDALRLPGVRIQPVLGHRAGGEKWCGAQRAH